MARCPFVMGRRWQARPPFYANEDRWVACYLFDPAGDRERSVAAEAND